MKLHLSYIVVAITVTTGFVTQSQTAAEKAKPISNSAQGSGTTPGLRLTFVHDKTVTELPKPTGVRSGRIEDLIAEEKAKAAGKVSKDIDQGGPKPPVKSSQAATLLLTKDTATREDDLEIIHFDFLNRRLVKVDKTKQTFQEDSMLADVAFRQQELQNRMRLAKAMAAAKIDLFPQEEMESIFGMHVGKKTPATLTTENGLVQANVNKRAVTTWSAKAMANVPEPFRTTWALYLRFAMTIHPSILDELIATNQIPEVLSNRSEANFNMTEQRIQFKSVNDIAVTPFTKSSKWQPAEAVEPELQALRSKVLQDKLAGKNPKPEDVESRINQLIEEKKLLDAFLGFNELILSFDPVPNDVLRRIVAAVNSDPEVLKFQKLIGKIRPGNKEVIKELEAFDRSGLTFGHVLDIKTGTAKMLNKDFPGARKSYLAALKASPFLAGAYHDLGGMDINTFRHQEAWRNWDTLRLLAPKHQLARPVGQFEQSILKHREFFLTQAPEPK